MKNKELQAELAMLDPEAEVYTIHSASGASSEAGYPHEETVDHKYHNIGSLCDVPNGTTVIIILVDG